MFHYPAWHKSGSAAPTPPPSPPPQSPSTNDANTKLLCHFDGGFTNSAIGGSSIIIPTNTTIATPAKFGSGAARVIGTSFLSVSNSTMPQLAAQDWTFSVCINLQSAISSAGIGASLLAKDGGNAIYSPLTVCLTSGGHVLVWASSGSGWDIFNGMDFGPINLPIGSYAHVELSREGSTWRLFKDGVLLTTKTASGSLCQTNSDWYFFGPFEDKTASFGLNALIDEMKFDIGIARNKQSFTPPSAPY